MGFHIGVITKNYEKQHPLWDSLRYIDDKLFINLFDNDDKHPPDWNSYGGVFRPRNLDKIKEKLELSKIIDKERYRFLISIFENDKTKEWWIDYS